MAARLLPALACCLVHQATALRAALDAENFHVMVHDSQTTAFVKFYSPECGHCRAMSRAWNDLEAAYADAPDVLVASVDCTSAKAEPLCEEQKIVGFPTMLYFTPLTGRQGEEFEGERSVEALAALVEDKLRTRCTVSDFAHCSEREKEYAARMMAVDVSLARREAKRLRGLLRTSGAMDIALQTWMGQRLNVLEQVAGP